MSPRLPKQVKGANMLIAYDAFEPQIQTISNWLIRIEEQLEQEALNQPIPYTLKRVREGGNEFNLSAVVESCLLKMARELDARPLSLAQWNKYYENYQELSQEAGKGETHAHSTERRVYLNEHGLNQMNAIVEHARRAGVQFPLTHRKDAPRYRLIIALAIQYTADNLPDLPDDQTPPE